MRHNYFEGNSHKRIIWKTTTAGERGYYYEEVFRMKRICLLFLLCISLMVCPVMAEENSETAAMVEQARVLMDEGN